ncbi:MAG: gamma-glutamylcyclotransferase [Paucibacter sp.]|nr:gamma-glutamylcyclotransferase [Roseateles sp.]
MIQHPSRDAQPADPTAGARLCDLPAHSLAALEHCRDQWDRSRGLMLFGYGSLIWNPGFEPDQVLPASVIGYHRALRLRSLVNRGNADQPGLVLALLSGGRCRGLMFRVAPERSAEVLERLWLREMVVGSYTPRWLRCRTPEGVLPALCFTLSRHSPGFVPELGDERLLHILRHAHGRYGTTLDYLVRTCESLRAHGIVDAELERQWRLAARHGLCTQPRLVSAASPSAE